MAINDILHGILALGAGSARRISTKRQRELDQRDEFQRAMIQMENTARLQERDVAKGQYEQGRLANAEDRTGIAEMLAAFKTGDEFKMRLGNVESLMNDRTADNARTDRLYQMQNEDRDALRKLREDIFKSGTTVDPTTGERKKTPTAAGGGSGKTIALQAYKQAALKSGELFGIPPSVNEAMRVMEMDGEFFDFYQRNIGEAGLKIGGLMKKADIEKWDAVTKEALSIYDEANKDDSGN